MHTHKCGFSLPLTDFMRGELGPPNGCGFEWTHAELKDDPAQTDATLTAAHMCPQCQRGPWPWQVNVDTKHQHSFECAFLGIPECPT